MKLLKHIFVSHPLPAVVIIVVLSLTVSMVFQSVFANVTVTPATGGSAISADTTGGSYTALTGPVIAEDSAGEVGGGGGGPGASIILDVPSGFIFDIAEDSVTATVTDQGTCGGSNKTIRLTAGSFPTQTVTPTTTTITINVKQPSTGTCHGTITYTGIKVRPTAGTPLAEGNITKSSSSTSVITGVTNGVTNFGTLIEVPGALDDFSFATISSPKIAGTPFDITMTAKDQFSNTITAFTETANLSTNADSISPTTSGAFSAGVRTENVTLTGSGTGKYITAAKNSVVSNSGSFELLLPDSTPPTGPFGLYSSDHATSTWSNDDTITMNWTAAVDEEGGSGLAGYSYLFDTNPTTTPDPTPNLGEEDITVPSGQLADGDSHYFHIRAVDNANNWGPAVDLGPFWIDTVPPTSTKTTDPSPPNGENDWFTSNVDFSVTADDDTSGVANIYVCVDQTNECDPQNDDIGTDSGTVTAEGNNYVRHRARDNANNLEDIQVNFIKIDKTDPTVTLDPLLQYDGDGYVNIIWDSGDSVSGVSQVEIYRDGDLITTDDPAGNYIDDRSGDNGQTFNYFVRARDYAGRTKDSQTETTTIDLDPPTVPSLLPLDSFINASSVLLKWYRAIDLVSGVDFYKVFRGGDPYGIVDETDPFGTNAFDERQFTDTSVSEGNTYTYEASSLDQAIPPNESSLSDPTSTTIDLTPPSTTKTFDPEEPYGNNGWFVSPFSVTLDCNDEISGCNETKVSINDGPFNLYTSPFLIAADDIYLIKYYSEDNAENPESVNSQTEYLDQTPPTDPGTPETPSPTPDTTPTWIWEASNDATSGLAEPAYLVEWSTDPDFGEDVFSDSSNTNSFTHGDPLPDNTWYFRVKAVDVAGNESDFSNGQVVIDTTLPAVLISESGGSTDVTETGATDGYTIVLNTDPAVPVVISLTPDSQVDVTPATLFFTPGEGGDWGIPQGVMVTAIDDDTIEGPHAGVITHSAVSGGPYNGIVIPVTASITDNDFASGSLGGTWNDLGLITPSSGEIDATEAITTTAQIDVYVTIASGTAKITIPADTTLSTESGDPTDFTSFSAADVFSLVSNLPAGENLAAAVGFGLEESLSTNMPISFTVPVGSGQFNIFRSSSTAGPWNAFGTCTNPCFFNTTGLSFFLITQTQTQTEEAPTGGIALLPGTFDSPEGPFSVKINGDAPKTGSRDVILTLSSGGNVDRVAISNDPSFQNAIQEKFIAKSEQTASVLDSIRENVKMPWYIVLLVIIWVIILLVMINRGTSSKIINIVAILGLIVFLLWASAVFGSNVKIMEKPWMLSAGAGTKTVYVKFYTAYGQASGVVSDAIIYEPVAGLEEKLEAEVLPTGVKFLFQRNLSFGMRNVDVRKLQEFLNSQGFVLANSGNGSPGQETEFFRSRTFEAVKKFQATYREQILLPWGLKEATGYFGRESRKVVNEILGRE